MPNITVPTRTGFTFGGYWTAANGGGTQYYTASGVSARTCDMTSDTTLYAQWTENVFEPNTPDASAIVDALDCTNLEFTVSGCRDYWVPQNEVSNDGVDAVRCDGILADDDYWTNTLSTTMTGPGQLCFCWKVDNGGDDGFTFEFDKDYRDGRRLFVAGLMANDDGTPNAYWAANDNGGGDDVDGYCTPEGEWVKVVCNVGEGEHTFRWFVASMFGNKTTGRGWLDEVSWTPADGGNSGDVPPSDGTGFIDALGDALEWMSGGDAEWMVVEDSNAVGGTCARSSAIGDSESTWLETTVDGQGTIFFRWKVSSQARLDRLTFSVDGETKSFIAGTTATVTNWAECSFEIDGDGPHSLRWIYTKSPSGMAGEDCGWLDNVQWMPVSTNTFGYGEALDTTELEWTSGGGDANVWEVVESPSFDGEDSCAAFANGVSGFARIATEVDGPGTISFRWRVESGTSFAGIAFMVDGEDVEYCENGYWAFFEYSVSDEGTHAFAWEYFWDGTPNGDAAFLDCVSWAPAGGAAEESVTVEGVTIPHYWLSHFAAPILDRFGGNYERTANATAANGVNKVWECYVAGLNPTNATDIFRTVIWMENGLPVIGWTPDLNEGGTKQERVYTVEGCESLTNGSWGPTNAASRFFRVKVNMVSEEERETE
jgi:uncharacterized repeat protein (TIGR02543 family)